MHAAIRSLTLGASLLALGMLGAWPAAQAQAPDAAAAYPSRPIRIIVPFSAGAGSDFLARLIGPKLTEKWGQQVVIDNRPSAAGTVAGEIVTRATPDGHTLMITTAARSSAVPDVPTVAESGLPGYVYDGWFGVFAPSRVPPAVVKKLRDEIARILTLPDVRERVHSIGMEPTPSSPQDLHKLLASEIEVRKKIFGAQAGKLQ